MSAEEAMAPIEDTGQVEETPVAEEGQAITTEDTGQAEPATASDDDSFFDPTDLPPELQKAYKGMQAAYTKKTQEIAANRRKIQEYDQFMQNPRAAIEQMARQMGIPIAQQEQQEFNPQSWDDVIRAAKEQAVSEFRQQMEPMFNEVRSWKRSQLESQFDESFPRWREYEDDMTALLQKHPSLVSDPDSLIRAAIPRSELESYATQKAMKKLQARTENARVGSGSKTTRTPSNEPSGPISFAEAVQIAKRRMAEEAKRR